MQTMILFPCSFEPIFTAKEWIFLRWASLQSPVECVVAIITVVIVRRGVEGILIGAVSVLLFAAYNERRVGRHVIVVPHLKSVMLVFHELWRNMSNDVLRVSDAECSHQIVMNIGVFLITSTRLAEGVQNYSGYKYQIVCRNMSSSERCESAAKGMTSDAKLHNRDTWPTDCRSPQQVHHS
ncbi:hypothetical protein PFISCL1PPCAC_2658, partial [Pristionchus fissidentatus]